MYKAVILEIRRNTTRLAEDYEKSKKLKEDR